MTREHWKAVLPFVQAFADGKTVTYDGCPITSKADFGGLPQQYRIVGPPKLRPWKQDELPHNAMFRRRLQQHHYLRVTYSTPVYVNITGSSVAYDELLTQWEHNTGSGEWSPCGVEEGGKS